MSVTRRLRSTDRPVAGPTVVGRRPGGAACPLAAALALTLAACGGGGGGDGPGGAPVVVDGSDIVGTPVGSDLVLESAEAGEPASGVDDELLLRNALARSSAGIGINVGNLRRLLGDDPSVPVLPGGDAASVDGEEILSMVDDGSVALLERTLGIDDPNARVTREGDVITVDPDDAALCADDPFSAFDDALALDGGDMTSTCLQLVAGLTTELAAMTEDSGVITYLFEGEPVVSTGYSPGGVVQELRLDGVARVLRRLEAIEGLEPGSVVPATIAGTLRWAARVFDDTPGSESGEIEIEVTETLRLGDDGTETAFSLEPSRVLRIGVDAATDSVTASVGWGALNLVLENAGDDGDISLTTVSLGGLTFELDARASDMASSISLSDIGIGGVPFRIRIDQSDALVLALRTFGVTLDADNGELTFDDGLGIDLMIDNLGGLLDDQARDYRARFTASAPAGTAILPREDDLIEIGAGSLALGVTASDGAGSTQSEVTASAGSCLGERDRAADGTAGTDLDAERLAADLDLVAGACP